MLQQRDHEQGDRVRDPGAVVRDQDPEQGLPLKQGRKSILRSTTKLSSEQREQREACIAKTAPNFTKVLIYIHSK